jgi:two-component system sensor histidine kinase PilS (NtrC family)
VTAVDVGRPLHLFASARLGAAAVVVGLMPLVPADLRPVTDTGVVAAVLATVVASSVALLVAPTATGRAAWLVSALDTVLITALVAATGGPRSLYMFLYVLSVVGACGLLPRVGALAVAGTASLLYAGLVVGRTLLPLGAFLDAPDESSAIEVLSVFVNAATLLVVAIVAGGLAQQYRTTRLELEARQKDLQNLEAFRTVILNAVGTGFIALDPDGRITALNPAAQNITGLNPNEVIGRPWSAFFGEVVPRGLVEAAVLEPFWPPARHETTLVHSDGRTIPVRFTFAALRSSTGGRLGAVVICEDLSEIRAMENRMRQADRLASLGRLAANIAHEIRNPLASITGAVEALSGATDPDERQHLTQIVARESARLNTIIQDFLEYARPARPAVARVNVGEIIEEVLTLLEHRDLPPGLKVVRDFPSSLCWPVDGQQLRQALWNLCLNAVEAMPDGGELRLEAAVADGWLEIAVADTGEGIPPADLPHVLEPFFSTKPGGSGLGLALVHRIAQDHGGDVTIHSAPGLGTRVVLRLPDTPNA